MAVVIGSNLLFAGKHFLDSRQGVAETVNDLKNWDHDAYPVPEGFEVYCQDNWYIYSPKTDNPVTGKFINRLADVSKETLNYTDTQVGKLKSEISERYQEKLSQAPGIKITENTVGLYLNQADALLDIKSTGELKTSINLISVHQEPGSQWSAQYRLTGKDGNPIGETISIPRDRFLQGIDFIEHATQDDQGWDDMVDVVLGDPYLKMRYYLANGSTRIQYIPLKSLIDIYTSGPGINVSADNVISIDIDPESAETLSVSKMGLRLDDQKYARYSEHLEHLKDKDIHVTPGEKGYWSSKLDAILREEFDLETDLGLTIEDYHTGKEYKDYF